MTELLMADLRQKSLLLEEVKFIKLNKSIHLFYGSFKLSREFRSVFVSL